MNHQTLAKYLSQIGLLMRNPINTLFIDHPSSVGESYFQHLMMASRFALRMALGGIACLLHGLPRLFIDSNELHSSMVAHRGVNAHEGNTDKLS